MAWQSSRTLSDNIDHTVSPGRVLGDSSTGRVSHSFIKSGLAEGGVWGMGVRGTHTLGSGVSVVRTGMGQESRLDIARMVHNGGGQVFPFLFCPPFTRFPFPLHLHFGLGFSLFAPSHLSAQHWLAGRTWLPALGSQDLGTTDGVDFRLLTASWELEGRRHALSRLGCLDSSA